MANNKFGAALAKSEERVQMAINGSPEQMIKPENGNMTEIRNKLDDTLGRLLTLGGDVKGARLDLPRNAHRIIEEIQYRLSVRGRRDLKKDDLLKIALMEFIDNHPELCKE